MIKSFFILNLMTLSLVSSLACSNQNNTSQPQPILSTQSNTSSQKIIWNLFEKLPLEAFDHTTEGMMDEDRKILLQQKPSSTWKVADFNPTQLEFKSVDPVAKMNVVLQAFAYEGTENYLVAALTRNADVRILEWWKYDSNQKNFSKLNEDPLNFKYMVIDFVDDVEPAFHDKTLPFDYTLQSDGILIELSEHNHHQLTPSKEVFYRWQGKEFKKESRYRKVKSSN